MINLNFRPKVEWRASAIPKKDGSLRYLLIPGDELKQAQRDILDYLYHLPQEIKPHYCATGFVPYRNTMTAARFHDRNSRLFIHLDVHNFFPSFPVNKVLEVFRNAKIPQAEIDYIEDFAVFHGKRKDQLPQGAPTSPFLTNIGMRDTDVYLQAFAKSRGYNYSRYADDLTFSVIEGPMADQAVEDRKVFVKIISDILYSQLGLSLAWKKTNFSFINSPRVPRRMLGITIRKDFLGYNAPRQMRKNTRAAVNNLYYRLKRGERKEDLWPEYWKVIGMVGYCNHVRSKSDFIVSGFDPSIDKEQYEYIRKEFNYADRSY